MAHAHDYQQTAIISQVSLKRSHQHIAYERFMPGGSLAFLPRAGNKVGVVLTVPTDLVQNYLALSDDQFLKKLQILFGYRLGKFIGIEARVSYPLHLLQAQQQVGSGWILLGNSAYVLHPIAAQGFNLGLRDIHAFVDLIGPASDLVNLKLNTFVEQRKPDQQKTLKFTHQLIEYFTPDSWPLNFARNLATVAASNIPIFRRRLYNL